MLLVSRQHSAASATRTLSTTLARRIATFVLLSTSRSTSPSSSSATRSVATAAALLGPTSTNNNKTVLLHRVFSSTSSSSSSSMDNQSKNNHPLVSIHHITNKPVDSTQDEARRLLRDHSGGGGQKQQQDTDGTSNDNNNNQALAVTASKQLQGRGTQGRAWEGGNEKQMGNLHLTVCIPIDKIPVKITLLPLQVAVLVADRINRLLKACRDTTNTSNDTNNRNGGDKKNPSSFPKTTVKWPNDVLVNDRKISGTLIENEIVDGVTWLLIGIGINVAFTPSLDNSPGMQLRLATCLQDYCNELYQVNLPNTTAQELGTDLAQALVEWAYINDDDGISKSKSDREMKIIEDWKSFAEFGKEYQIRADDVKIEQPQDEEENGSNNEKKRYEGEKVITVGIHYDGQLRVRGEDGRERLIVAEYMF